jgi:hypothetical protein
LSSDFLQPIIDETWQVQVDLRAYDSALLFLSGSAEAPIGVDGGANPVPSKFESELRATELSGVPGVPGSTTSSIYFALLQVGQLHSNVSLVSGN